MNVIDNTGSFSKFLGIRFIPIFPKNSDAFGEKATKTGFSGKAALDKETQAALISEIKKLIESGIKSNEEILTELDERGLIPEIDGIQIKDNSVGKYITKARKELNVPIKQKKA